MNRDDLRVRFMARIQGTSSMFEHHRPVSDADLASLGYVKGPACGECEGGMQWWRPDPAYPSAELMGRTCPSCGGTGSYTHCGHQHEDVGLYCEMPVGHAGDHRAMLWWEEE